MREFVTVPAGDRIAGRKLLGSGGQGEVWLGQAGGRDVAVKVYHQHTATTAQRACIERVIDKGPPASCFLWPLTLVEDRAAGTYGYVMELRAQRFRSLEDFMARRIVPTFRALMTAAWQLADGFLRLHSLGSATATSRLPTCSSTPSTETSASVTTTTSTSPAPPRAVCSARRASWRPRSCGGRRCRAAETDRYSLAVLLFYLLMGGHPLDGERERPKIRCLDVPALEKLYGFEPLYVFDPRRRSRTGRVKGVHDNPLAFEHLYPTSRSASTSSDPSPRVCTTPTKRVRESEWRKVFSRARDSILYCGACGAENFYDAERLRSTGAQGCWSCAATLVIPPRIRIGADVVLLNRDTRLYNHHLGSPSGTEVVVAEVVPNPRDPSLFGLKNLTSETWTVTKPDATVMDVPPGRAAPIISGNVVNFGPVTGEVRV
jgi:hypothetical protein